MAQLLLKSANWEEVLWGTRIAEPLTDERGKTACRHICQLDSPCYTNSATHLQPQDTGYIMVHEAWSTDPQIPRKAVIFGFGDYKEWCPLSGAKESNEIKLRC